MKNEEYVNGAVRLTEDQRELIIDLRDKGVPVRKVADLASTSQKTVVAVYKKHLTLRRKYFDENPNGAKADITNRLEVIANRSRAEAFKNEDDVKAYQTWLKQEQDALIALAKLNGLDAPAKIEHSGNGGFILMIDDTPKEAPTE